MKVLFYIVILVVLSSNLFSQSLDTMTSLHSYEISFGDATSMPVFCCGFAFNLDNFKRSTRQYWSLEKASYNFRFGVSKPNIKYDVGIYSFKSKIEGNRIGEYLFSGLDIGIFPFYKFVESRRFNFNYYAKYGLDLNGQFQDFAHRLGLGAEADMKIWRKFYLKSTLTINVFSYKALNYRPYLVWSAFLTYRF